MPGTSKAKHPRGYEITFEESTHKYSSIINGKEISYTSGTGVIHACFPPFDPSGEITKRCALKEGITVEELKAKWKAKGDASCKFGTRVHECCEDIELGKSEHELRNKPQDAREEIVFKHAINMARKFRQQLDILGVEKIVFSPELRIAGTIDLFARSKKTGDWIIIDHKTNQTIDTENKWSNFALPPIEHIPDINFWHYAGQLNLYQYLLQREGYVPKRSKFRLFLNHLTESGAKLIELPDMQLEIRDIIVEHLLKMVKSSNI